MTHEEYHAIDAISASDLKDRDKGMIRSMAHWKWHKDNPTDTETEAQILGQAVHMKLLQPHLYDNKYAVWNDTQLIDDLQSGKIADAKGKSKKYVKPKASDIYKAEKKKHEDANPGKQTVSQEFSDIVTGIANAAMQNPHFAEWLNDPQSLKEHALFWKDGDTDMKAMIDLICGHVIVDVKTTNDARYDSFMREAHRYGYFLQGAVYVSALESTGIENPTFILLACEKEPPYLCQPFVIGRDTIDYQKTRIDRLLREYEACVRSGIWSGYKTDPVMLEMPIYALSDEL